MGDSLAHSIIARHPRSGEAMFLHRLLRVTAALQVLASLALACLLPGTAARAAALTVAVASPEPPIRFGAEQLAAALRGGGDAPRVVTGRVGNIRIGHLGTPAGMALAAGARLSVAYTAESFTIGAGSGGVTILGRDAAGAMYGCLEAADEVRAAIGGAKPPRAAITARRRTPFLAIRGDSPCLTLENGRPSATFYDVHFWQRYLETLARARYNTLDLQAALDLTTGSLVNGLALFADPPVFPQAAREPAEVHRSVEMLRRIVALAHDRSIRVILTNRALEAAIPAALQPAYVKQAVTRLRQAVPELWAIGHRAPEGEALAPALLAAYAAAARPNAQPRLPDLLPAGSPLVPLLLARPFNGDQFGLPYPVEPASELALPAGTVAVWQIGGGAAHRALPFANADMIRRVVQSCRRGHGIGILIEPIDTYGPQEAQRVLAKAEQAKLYAYTFERHWAWYALWGRLAYNPDAPPSLLWSEFRGHFGYDPGEFIYNVSQNAGRVVPTLFAYHTLGTGLRDQAPEFEIANRRDRSAGAGDIRDFLRVGTLDPEVLASPRAWAEAMALGQRDARGGPVDVSYDLAWLSMRIRGDIATIDDLKPRSPREWARMRADLLALAKLADHYAARISGAAHLALHQASGDEMELILADAQLAGARAAWAEMVQEIGPDYRPLAEPLKLRTEVFTWEEEGKLLEQDATALAAIRARYDAERLRPRPLPRIAHIPLDHGAPARALRITATVLAGDAPPAVTLHYTPPGELAPRAVPMTRMYKTDAVYVATLPGTELREGWLSYRIEAQAVGRSAWWPAPEPQPARTVPITPDTEAPRVETLTALLPGAGDGRPTTNDQRRTTTVSRAQSKEVSSSAVGRSSFVVGPVRITANVQDPAGVAAVTLHYRSLTVGESWRSLAMTADRNSYEAMVPLSPDGLAYRLTVTDIWGNTALFPDYRSETPYRVVGGR
jgi:hypothetical protein